MTEIFVSTFVTLFVIMDPVGTIPVFLSLTAGQSAGTQRRAAVLAVAVSFLVITIFALFGQAILRYLHISLEALQCAGGLLLLLVALELLTDNFDDPVAAAGQDDGGLAADAGGCARDDRDGCRAHARTSAGVVVSSDGAGAIDFAASTTMPDRTTPMAPT